MMTDDCPICGHQKHLFQCGAPITEEIRDDVGIFAPPSGLRTTQIIDTCHCFGRGSMVTSFCDTCKQPVGCVGLYPDAYVVEVHFKCNNCDRHIMWRSA